MFVQKSSRSPRLWLALRRAMRSAHGPIPLHHKSSFFAMGVCWKGAATCDLIYPRTAPASGIASATPPDTMIIRSSILEMGHGALSSGRSLLIDSSLTAYSALYHKGNLPHFGTQQHYSGMITTQNGGPKTQGLEKGQRPPPQENPTCCTSPPKFTKLFRK